MICIVALYIWQMCVYKDFVLSVSPLKKGICFIGTFLTLLCWLKSIRTTFYGFWMLIHEIPGGMSMLKKNCFSRRESNAIRMTQLNYKWFKAIEYCLFKSQGWGGSIVFENKVLTCNGMWQQTGNREKEHVSSPNPLLWACSVLDLRIISNNGKRKDSVTKQEWVRDQYFRQNGTKWR